MAGFFGLFGGNKKKAPQSKEAFFLSEDESKSFGDIDFMRKEVVVRRTFAKKKGQTEELESVKSISSGTSRDVGETTARPTASFSSFSAPTPASAASSAPAAESAPTSATPASESPQPPVRREPDNGMDMFRNMAKNLRR